MISLLFWCIAAILNASMDTLAHHWYQSIFFKWAGGITTSFWGPPDQTWVRKYKNNAEFGLIRNETIVQLSDAWHLSKTLMILFLSLAVYYYQPISLYVYLINLTIENEFLKKLVEGVLYIATLGIAWNYPFNGFYNKILKLKTWYKE